MRAITIIDGALIKLVDGLLLRGGRLLNCRLAARSGRRIDRRSRSVSDILSKLSRLLPRRFFALVPIPEPQSRHRNGSQAESQHSAWPPVSAPGSAHGVLLSGALCSAQAAPHSSSRASTQPLAPREPPFLGRLGFQPGRPGDCSPGLPQSRACPIQAPGSSCRGVAVPHTIWSPHGDTF
jgi:hypothetical protein